MIIKGIKEEDFLQYKNPSMLVAFPSCTFKCEKECLACKVICQNSALVKAPDIEISPKAIVDRYLSNPITKALVCGGLEPFDSWEDLRCFVTNIRYWTPDPIIIYTGYNEDEIVSSDIVGITYGSLFDATQTMVAKIDDDTYQVQVVSWYDNENSYTSQMVRTIKYFSELG